MTHSPNETINALDRIGAPSVLVELARGTTAPGKLRWQFQEPKEFYALINEHPGNMPFESDLIPLWETNGDSITAFVDVGKPRVIRYYYEDPETDYEQVGDSVMEAIEHRLAWLLLECETDRVRIVQAAADCDHPDPEGFVTRLESESAD